MYELLCLSHDLELKVIVLSDFIMALFFLFFCLDIRNPLQRKLYLIHGSVLTAKRVQFVVQQVMMQLCFFAMGVIKVTIWNVMIQTSLKSQKELGCVVHVKIMLMILNALVCKL